jgi:hypothetical protein
LITGNGVIEPTGHIQEIDIAVPSAEGQSSTMTQQRWQRQQFLSWNMEGPTWANKKTEMALPA